MIERHGDYELDTEDVLGRGGMGVVVRGRRCSTGEPVAVKVLLPELSADAEAIRRFRRETSIGGKLAADPGIVAVYDTWVFHGRHYMAMELVDGPSLREVLAAAGPPPAPAALDLMRQSARAVAYAHTHGVVHRDLKPGNIMIASGGRVKIVDFGIAKVLESRTALTAPGSSYGTPDYMSPEQVRGKDVDARSDVYSLGCVYFELATGKPPFQGDPMAVMYQHVNETPRDPRTVKSEVSVPLAKVIWKCLKKNPGERYASAADLAAALDAVESTHAAVTAVPGSTLASLERWAGDSAAPSRRIETSLRTAALRPRRHLPRRAVAIALCAAALIVLGVGLWAVSLAVGPDRTAAGGGAAPGIPLTEFRVESDPKPWRLIVESADVNTAGHVAKLPAGSHTVRIEYPDSIRLTLDVEITAGKPFLLKVPPSLLEALVEEKRGAIDRAFAAWDRAGTEILDPKLDALAHLRRKEALVALNRRSRIRVTPPEARVTLISGSPGFEKEIPLLGSPERRVPDDLEPGGYALRIESTGWKTSAHAYDHRPGQAVDLPPLKREVATLTFSGWTPGDQIFRVESETETLIVVTQSDHPTLLPWAVTPGRFKLRVKRIGFESWESDEIEAKSSERIPVSIPELELTAGWLRVDSDPAGAAVTQSDGTSWGKTPLVREIQAGGKCEIRILVPGHEDLAPVVRVLDLSRNRAFTEKIDLTKIAWLTLRLHPSDTRVRIEGKEMADVKSLVIERERIEIELVHDKFPILERREMLELLPGHQERTFDLWQIRGADLEGKGDLLGALEAYGKAEKPDSAALKDLRSRIAKAEARKAAEKTLQEVAARCRRGEFDAARRLAKQVTLEGPAELTEQAHELIKHADSLERELTPLLSAARALKEEGKWEELIKAADRIRAKCPDHVEARSLADLARRNSAPPGPGNGAARELLQRPKNFSTGNAVKVLCIDISPDGKYLACGYDSPVVDVYDLQAGRLLQQGLDGTRSDVRAVAFTPDGQSLFAQGLNGTFVLWNTSSWVRKDLKGMGTYRVFCPESSDRVWRWGHKNLVCLYDGSGGKVVWWGLQPPGVVESLEFSGDFKLAATGCRDGKFFVFRVPRDVDEGICEPAMQGALAAAVTSLAFCDRNSLLLTASGNGDAIRRWDISGAELKEITPELKHGAKVSGLAARGDAALASSGDDGVVRIWDLRTAKNVENSPRREGRKVTCVAFTPDGKKVVYGDDQGGVWVCPVSLPSTRR